MSILSIAWKDLQILFRDRNGLVLTFLLPVVFIMAFLGIAGANDNDSEQAAISMSVVALGDGGTEQATFIDNLNLIGGIAAQEMSEADALALLEAEEVRHVLIIPATFEANLAAGVPTELRLIHNTLNREESTALAFAIDGVARDMTLEHQIVATLNQMAAMQGGSDDSVAAPASEAVPLARAQMAAARQRPLITVSKRPAVVNEQEEAAPINAVQIAVPGFAVLFVFLTAQTTARSIYDERKTGSFRRLLAAPLGTWRLLLGKMIPNFVVVLLQIGFLFLAGIFLLPLIGLDRLSLGNDFGALLILVTTVALCSTSLGLVIAALARTEAQIGGISGVVLWVLAFLGGSFLPLFLMDEKLATVGKITPHYWAVTGFFDVLTRGHGLPAIYDSLLILAVFTALFFAIGAWRFEFR